MRKLNYLILLLIGLAFTLISCEHEPVVAPAPEVDTEASIHAQKVEMYNEYLANSSNKVESNARAASASFVFLMGSCAAAPNGHTFCIDVGVPFDDIITVHPKSAEGSGNWAHFDENGVEVASGEWTATELLSFKDYGPSPINCQPPFPDPCPDDWNAGIANIRIHLDAGFDAILRLYCRLPGIKLPPSMGEGLKVNVQGGINFNELLPGGTLYIRLP